MKKVLFMFVAMIIAISTAAQSSNKVEIRKEGNTFIASKSTKSSYQPTGYYYVDTDGVKYEIYIHTTKKSETKCYVQRTSKKSGKQYWKEIYVKPEELK